jgi:murein DD-endopeptidase MepM/ murein hydrolase activator NlpD
MVKGMDRPTPPYGSKLPNGSDASQNPVNGAAPEGTGDTSSALNARRGSSGGRPANSAIGGAIKSKLSGQGSGISALKGAQNSDNETVSDVANIAQAAMTGAAKGGVGGAIASATIAGLKSKTGRKALVLLLVGIPVVIAVALASMFSPDPSVSVGGISAMRSAASYTSMSKVVTDSAVVQNLSIAARNNGVPMEALTAVYQTQSINKTSTGPFGIDLAAAGTGKNGIDEAGAMKLTQAADFVANKLSISMRTAMQGTDNKSLNIGMLQSADSNGKTTLIPGTSDAAVKNREDSKSRWVKAFKALPLTGISDNAGAIYDLASTFAAAGQCQPMVDSVHGTPTAAQTPFSLNDTQKGFAQAIVRRSVAMGLDRQAAVIAIMTALTESSMQMLWNPKVPNSETFAKGGAKGIDGFSVGLFQQQVNGSAYSWGTVEEAMDPSHSAGSFYARLQGIKNWQELDLGVAAQKVQVSAVPDAYAKYQTAAEGIVKDALASLGSSAPSGASSASPSAPAASTDPTKSADCLGKNLGTLSVGDGTDPTGMYIRPIVGGSISQFGWRFHPIHLEWRIHYGNDFAMPSGTPIYAIAAGVVSYSGPAGDYGNHIVIDHAGDVGSSYSHILDGGLLVKVGDRVVQGQMIAKVGSTGGSTGAHLHFEISYAGRAIDALAYMTNRTIRHDSDCGPKPSPFAPHD